MLQRFESFKPRQLDARKETPQGKKAEQERKDREERYAQFTFTDGVPDLMIELAQRLLLDISDVDQIEEGVWTLAYNQHVYISFNILKDEIGFLIVDKNNNDIYKGEDVDEAESAIYEILDQVEDNNDENVDESTSVIRYQQYSQILESLKLEDDTKFSSYIKTNFDLAMSNIVEEMQRNIENRMTEYGFEVVFSNLDKATKEVYGGFFFKTEKNKYFLRIEGLKDIDLYVVTKLSDETVKSDFNVIYSYMLKNPYVVDDNVAQHKDSIINLGRVNSLSKMTSLVRSFEKTDTATDIVIRFSGISKEDLKMALKKSLDLNFSNAEGRQLKIDRSKVSPEKLQALEDYLKSTQTSRGGAYILK